ncbi:CAP domain-containing protein [Meiothermus sp. QL-1]|uniref:CAP domain-containing protein n=1 Tax=Meiothermus sp. QL-1 TaxID=2058095 RepID=UPI000E0A8FD5|nr:CAP domain-containing protein [Meiothermus sp. QL-1]RDI96032.1 CAP domain-containing protein [Meiothermus sp. QL-1]
MKGLVWLLLLGFTWAWAQGPEGLEARVLSLINQARAKGVACRGGGGGYSLPPLRPNSTLAQVARGHARDMARHGFVSHYFQGVGPRLRVARAGYRYLRMSEIIFKGRSGDPARAVRWWLRSPTHCRAIMNPYYTEAGAGFRGNAWVVVLAQPR